MSQNMLPWDDRDAFLIAFSLGPVQPFIETARSVRDLWTGSYLLSWLTFQAMRPLRELNSSAPESPFLFPSLRGVPLLELFRAEPELTRSFEADDLLTPCLPNKFLALVTGGHNAETAHALAAECEQACRDAWAELSRRVRGLLHAKIETIPELEPFHDSWGRLWNIQAESYFEVRTCVLPVSECDASTLDEWLGVDANPDDPERIWTRRFELLGRVAEAARGVRHVPNYRVAGAVPNKCSLFGSFEQMGPSALSESRRFWGLVAAKVRIGGSRIDENERFCALGLTKRFAWPAYLASALGIVVESRRFPDTATVAAARWLVGPAEHPESRLDWKQMNQWNGRWLHWTPRSEYEDENEQRSHRMLRSKIAEKVRAQGPPPTYFAVLVMDGDHMGRWLRGEMCTETGRELQTRISEALSKFAIGPVRRVVEDMYFGTLIYSGGDDVLALLPTETVLEAASTLRRTYLEHWPRFAGSQGATLSAGIAVVHIKEDLRFALDTARRAEKLAKDSGRDILALSVCRRSGEHSRALLPWSQTAALQRLVGRFRDQHSDRWTYKLRAEFPTLRGLDWEAVAAEMRRLIGRTVEAGPRELAAWAEGFLDAYSEELTKERRGQSKADVLNGFITLCQSAAFLARGRDES